MKHHGHSSEISVNIPAFILIIWSVTRLFFRWFSDYYYTEFGMVLDIIAIVVLFYLAKDGLGARIIYQKDGDTL